MKKPLIGITPLFDEHLNSWWMIPGYMEGVLEAGGIPVMLPFTGDPEAAKELASHMDGFIFTGGPDANPMMFGDDYIFELGVISPKRDINEKLFLEAALADGKPVLGVCRGFQLINCMLGGKLYLDLPTQHPGTINHDQHEKNHIPTHTVDLVEGTPMHDWMGKAAEIPVNTYHHQGIRILADSLSPMAYAHGEDLIEAFYSPGHKFLCGVQWHPELLRKTCKEQLEIFKALIKACE